MEDESWRNITDHVRVGTGTKVHRKARGSSVTYCGLWTGTHGIWIVKEPSNCKKCGISNETIEIFTEKSVQESVQKAE